MEYTEIYLEYAGDTLGWRMQSMFALVLCVKVLLSSDKINELQLLVSRAFCSFLEPCMCTFLLSLQEGR